MIIDGTEDDLASHRVKMLKKCTSELKSMLSMTQDTGNVN